MIMGVKRNSIMGLNERDIMTRIRIINSFKLNEEAFLKKYFCDRDSLFNICLPSFKKLLREKADIKFISLYLANLKKFISLLKNINEDNTNNTTQKQNISQKDKYLKLLKYVSEHVLYEYFAPKRLVLRYGELGSKYYIILHGVVSILIPVRINIQMTFFEFSKYVATLLLYKEFELAKIVIRENKHVYRLDLPDMKYIINYFNKNNEEDEDVYIRKTSNNNLLKNMKSEKNIYATKIVHKITKYLKEKDNTQDDKSEEEDKIFEAEYALRLEKFMKLCLTSEQMKLFEEVKKERKEIEKDDGIELSSELYINRLKSYKFNINENNTDNNNIINNNKERLKKKFKSTRRLPRSKTSHVIHDKENQNEGNKNYYLSKNKNSVYIYEYQEIIQLETGEMFGDTALGSSTSKRTATIISSTDCHFGCLNKDIYTYIKFSNDKNRKNMINYISRTRIFKSLKYKTIEEKFINYFAFKNCVKNEYLIKIGEINNNIIIIKSGKFEINVKGGILNIFQLINQYKYNFEQMKEYGLSDNIIRKINKLNSNRNKIEKLFGINNTKNINDIIYKLFVINSSSIFGFKESEKKEKEDYVSFLEIKCISSEGEYILLDKRIFYRQMYSMDFKVKEETRIYIKEFIDRTINRLVHILYSKIYYILSKNNKKYLRNIKMISNIKEENNKNETSARNLISVIKLDFDYMNKYDLTDIECVIDKILSIFNEEDFDNENIDINSYIEKENYGNSKGKNIIKLGKEKYNIINNNIIFKNIKYKNKQNLKFRNINNQPNNNNRKNIRKLSDADKIQNLFNFISDKKVGNNIKYSKLKIKTGKNNSYIEEKKMSFISENKYKNKRKYNNLFSNNISINTNEINKNASVGIFGKTTDSFMSDININCNYANYGNACISKLNFSFKKDSCETPKYNKRFNLKLDKLKDIKMNKIFGSDRCFSSKRSNYSTINVFDTNKTNKELYSENRQKYILKCVKNIWTRNCPIVLYKRKKKFDKNV